MLKKILFFILILFPLSVSHAFSWGGAFYWSPTHQVILTEAYNFLSQDPAFQGSGFLSLNSILLNEGVLVNVDYALDPSVVGPGPDATGASPYQWHYYNPLTGKGRAPAAVQMYYKQLVDLNDKNDKGKAAAWSAHFLADMSVPYHIVGMPSDEAIKYRNSDTQYLSEDITGPLLLYDNKATDRMPPTGWGENHLFGSAIVNFVDDHSGGDVDWFDPWYSNGSGLKNSHEVAFSSHVLWEADAHKKYLECGYTGIVASEVGRYNPAWKNGAPNINFNINIMEAQAAGAALFTHDVALYTRKQILHIHRNAEVGIFNAMRNVATLWRGSITGLRPALYYYEKVSSDPNEYGVECRIRNMADASAKNVQIKLYVFHNQKLVHTHKLAGGNIVAGGTGSVQFRVGLIPDREYGIAMAVAARYDIPDLQYATVNGIFRSRPGIQKPGDDYKNRHDPFAGILGTWEFGRNKNDFIGNVVLTSKKGKHGYIIDGYSHPNETYWRFSGKNSIVFVHKNGNPTTYFKRLDIRFWEGRFLPPKDWPKMKNAIVHYLKRK